MLIKGLYIFFFYIMNPLSRHYKPGEAINQQFFLQQLYIGDKIYSYFSIFCQPRLVSAPFYLSLSVDKVDELFSPNNVGIAVGRGLITVVVVLYIDADFLCLLFAPYK